MLLAWRIWGKPICFGACWGVGKQCGRCHSRPSVLPPFLQPSMAPIDCLDGSLSLHRKGPIDVALVRMEDGGRNLNFPKEIPRGSQDVTSDLAGIQGPVIFIFSSPDSAVGLMPVMNCRQGSPFLEHSGCKYVSIRPVDLRPRDACSVVKLTLLEISCAHTCYRFPFPLLAHGSILVTW